MVGADASATGELAAELAALHRGRGVRRPQLAAHLGPELRQVLGLAENVSATEARLTLVDALIAATGVLPPDLQFAFLHASAIRNPKPLLGARLEDVGHRLDRDQRTVRRRLQEANAMVAAQLVARRAKRAVNPMAPEGWSVLALTSVLDLRPDRPYFLSDRTMLIGQPLTEMTETVSIPRFPGAPAVPDIEVEILSGGRLSSLERIANSAWRFGIAFDRVLHSGETPEMRVRLTVPSADVIAPYNSAVPFRAIATFRCEVYFRPDQLPPAVRRIDALPPSTLTDPVDPSVGEPPPADGHAVTHFDTLLPGLAYGLTWAS